MAPPRICSIDGCGKRVKARNLCDKHLARWYKRGDPNFEYRHQSPLRQFIHDVAIAYEGDDCLNWPFGKTANGYGAIYVGRRQRGVHVLVCELVRGQPPDASFEVAHSCGNRACCNPKHLRWTSRADNHADKVQHGTAMRGERHHKAKVTEADVRDIRALHGQLSMAKIAKRYGLCAATVREIIHRKIWAWLD